MLGTNEIGYSHFTANFTEPSINKAKNQIKFISKLSSNGRTTNIGFGYFELDGNGVITKCERGYTKDYKGIKVVELDKFPPTRMFGREL